MLTTLGCPGTPDPRNSSVDKFLSREISELRNPCAETDHPSRLSTKSPQPGIPRLRKLSAEEFLGSGVFGHPRVVLGQPNLNHRGPLSTPRVIVGAKNIVIVLSHLYALLGKSESKKHRPMHSLPHEKNQKKSTVKI